MLEFSLRSAVFVVSVGLVVAGYNMAIWVTKPLWTYLLGREPEVAVTIAPVGIIESGKVKEVEGGPVANQLLHRLGQISELLRRDLSKEYLILQRAGASIPRMRVDGSETFQLTADNEISFEVEVFKFDVAGLLTFLNRQLDKRDQVKVLAELRDGKSRLFIDVARVNGGGERLITEGGPSLNEAIDLAACAVMRTYRKDDLFHGLDPQGFCTILGTIEDFQTYIVHAASSVETNGKLDQHAAERIMGKLQDSAHARYNSPVIHFMLAGLLKLKGDHVAAAKRLESAAAIIPQHEFVKANLAHWQAEAATATSQTAALEAAKEKLLTATERANTQKAILEQPELQRIKYPEMLRELSRIKRGKRVLVAVFSTGFTPPPEPTALEEIRKTLNLTDDASSEDSNGHGNMVVHLLAALTESDRVEILPVKVLSDSGVGGLEVVTDGLNGASKEQADVFAIPLGMEAAPGQYTEIFERVLADLKTVSVAAAGNSANRKAGYLSTVNLPAAIPSVIAVGGDTPDGGWANFSPGPEGVDVVAPSVDLLVTITGRDMRKVSGTSFSTIIVAALVASAKSIMPELGEREIVEAFRITATKSYDPSKPDTINALEFIRHIEKLSQQH